MGAPRNYSHLTPDNVLEGRKYHVTIEELLSLPYIGNVYTTVLQNSGNWSNGSGVSSGNLDVEIFKAYTGEIYNVLQLSGNWNDVYSLILNNSAYIINDIYNMASVSGIWNEVTGNLDNKIINYNPVNYIISGNTLSNHLNGIDNKLIEIGEIGEIGDVVGFTFVVISQNYNIPDNSKNIGYLISNKDNNVTITLPENSNRGDLLYFKVIDFNNNYNITIDNNNKKIENILDSLQLNSDSEFMLIYSGTDYGWVINIINTGLTVNWFTSVLNQSRNITWNLVNSNTNIINNNGYFVNAENNDITLTLPLICNFGDAIFIKPINLQNTITVNRNGHKIEQQSEDLIIDTNVLISLIYINNTYGWGVIIN